RRGKYLMVVLDSSDLLLMHLGMSGSFRLDRRSPPSTAEPHDHVVFELSNGAVLTFNDPRRFGLMDLLDAGQVAGHRVLKAIGPEPLTVAFDAEALARACAGKRAPLKAALLDQRVVAGLGNIYAREALHLARLSPRRTASTIATRGGKPRPSAVRLAAAIKKVLQEAIARTRRSYRTGRFRVYDREGEACLRRGCGGTIRRLEQAGRSTFYCPTCQR